MNILAGLAGFATLILAAWSPVILLRITTGEWLDRKPMPPGIIDGGS